MPLKRSSQRRDSLDRRYQELLEQVRLLDTEAFQLKGYWSRGRKPMLLGDSKRLEQEGKR